MIHRLAQRHAPIFDQVVLVEQVVHGEIAASGGVREVAVHPRQDDLGGLWANAGVLVRHDFVDHVATQLRAFTQHGVSDTSAQQVDNRVAAHCATSFRRYGTVLRYSKYIIT